MLIIGDTSLNSFRRLVVFGGRHTFFRFGDLSIMRRFPKVLERGSNLISVLEFKRLLVDLQSKRPDICLRYRLLGEMWAIHALRVVRVTEKGVILSDDNGNRFVNLPDLSAIMQFEIDAPFQGFQPHYHYTVKPTPEFSSD